MTGKEALVEIRKTRTADQQFVKWWRKEEDYLDFENIDTYLLNTKDDEEVGGFELLTMADMWNNLEKVAPGRVQKTQKGGELLIDWRRKTGEERHCPYTPQSFIDIFDAETRGNYVD